MTTARAPPAEGGERPTFDAQQARAFRKLRARGDAGGDTAAFRRAEKPAFAGKPRFKPGYGGKPAFGDKKPGGFKKKYVGKAAGAKGSYKGGKAERAKRGV